MLHNVLLSFWKLYSKLKYCGEPRPVIIFSLVFQFVAKGFATRHLTYRPSPKSTYSSKCSKGELILKHILTAGVLFFFICSFLPRCWSPISLSNKQGRKKDSGELTVEFLKRHVFSEHTHTLWPQDRYSLSFLQGKELQVDKTSIQSNDLHD